jgi:hypothetical protein
VRESDGKELSGGSSEMGINLGSTIIDKKERIDEGGKERGTEGEREAERERERQREKERHTGVHG